jgi:hypothetical protein
MIARNEKIREQIQICVRFQKPFSIVNILTEGFDQSAITFLIMVEYKV